MEARISLFTALLHENVHMSETYVRI